MAGIGKLYSNFRRFLIAYFTDHNDIRIMLQDGSQRQLKIHLQADFELAGAVDDIFNRVFHCQNVYFRLDDMMQ